MTNGYVIYPSSTSQMKLAAAKRQAKAESIENGKARVESCDTGRTIARYENGLEVK